MTTPKINWTVLITELGADVSMGLTFVAGLAYELSDPKYGKTDIAAFIPPQWKHDILVAGAVSTVLLRSGNAIMRAFRAAQVAATAAIVAPAQPAPDAKP